MTSSDKCKRKQPVIQDLTRHLEAHRDSHVKEEGIYCRSQTERKYTLKGTTEETGSKQTEGTNNWEQQKTDRQAVNYTFENKEILGFEI